MALYIQFLSSEDLLSMIAPLLIAGVIYLFAFEGGAISNILKTKPFIFLGTLSYSIYMTHIFISGKFFELPIRLLQNNGGINISIMQNGRTLYGPTLLYGTLLEAFYLLTVIACSFISYKLIEEPCRNLSKRLVAPRT